MTDEAIAIRVEALSKVYKIYASPRDMLIERITRRQRHKTFTALRDIGLIIKRGSVMGVMGPNGAGKSTLLKLITGTIRPTTGSIDVRGRVSAILELGTGFTPHNTGRENIRMGGLCLGMTMDEIRAKEEQIIAFSELDEFIDQPFQTYSTGMQARLTFAVAISPDPDVLIVDEALAVGDARFQQKCFGRIRAMRDTGTTILLVSHDDNTISSFCDDAIILLKGKKEVEGPASDMAVKYHRILFATEAAEKNAKEKGRRHAAVTASKPNDDLEAKPAYSNGKAELIDFGLTDRQGNKISEIESGGPCRLFFRMRALTEMNGYTVGMAIRDRRATVLWGLTSMTEKFELPKLEAGQELTSATDLTMWLSEGEYFLALGSADAETGEKHVFADGSLSFRVRGPSGIFTTACVNLQSKLEITIRKECALQNEYAVDVASSG